MNSSTQTPKLPMWIFIATDVALLGAAAFIASQSARPLSPAATLAIVACAMAGAVVGLVPLIVRFERQKNEALDDRQRALEALARTLASSADQLSIAAGSLHEIADLAQKNLRHVDQLPHKLQEKIGEFQAQLTQATDTEKEELERELLALRTTESERLESVSQRIAKSSADWAKLESATQQHLTTATEALARLSLGTASAIGKAQAAAEQALTQARAEAARGIGEASGHATRAIEDAKIAALSDFEARFNTIAAASSDRIAAELGPKLEIAAKSLDSKIARLEAAAREIQGTPARSADYVPKPGPARASELAAEAPQTQTPAASATRVDIAAEGSADPHPQPGIAPHAIAVASAAAAAATAPAEASTGSPKTDSTSLSTDSVAKTLSAAVSTNPGADGERDSQANTTPATPATPAPAATPATPKRSRKSRREEAPAPAERSTPAVPVSSAPEAASQAGGVGASSAVTDANGGAAAEVAAPAFATEEPAPIPAEKIPEVVPIAPQTAEPFSGNLASTDAGANGAASVESAHEVAASPVTHRPARRAPVRKSNAQDEAGSSLELDNEPAISGESSERVLTSDGATRLIVTAYIGIGNRLFIRGDGPGLSWEKGVPLQFVSIGKWRWETNDANGPVRFKVYKNDELECSALGTQTLDPGHQKEVAAAF